MSPHTPFLFCNKYHVNNLNTCIVSQTIRCAKALDRGAARLCILADDCDNQEYKSLVQALCSENNVHVIMADAGTDLAEWVGLAKLNADGTVRKVKKCSVAVVTDFGEESRELSIVLNHVREQA